MENPDVCRHKYQTCVYVGIQKYVQSLYPQGTHKNPDVWGHSHQLCVYVDIEIHI